MAANSAVGSCSELQIEVSETAGLRRQSYPLNVLVELPQGVPRMTPFRLVSDGRPMTAQVRPASAGASVSRWWVDFLVDLAPNQLRICSLAYGPDVEPAKEPSKGHELQEFGDTFVISNAPHIAWTVRRDLKGLLRSVSLPQEDRLRPESPGLTIRDRSGREHELGGPGVSSHVLRSGRLAVGLRFEGRLTEQTLNSVRFVVEMVFPARVSWVDVTCRVEDSKDQVAALGAGLNLVLDAPTPDAPTLVDLGATTYVYSSLRAGERTRLETGSKSQKAASPRSSERGWQILRGRADDLWPVAVCRSARLSDPIPEGWAHVMDRRRCLALAVGEFGHPAGGDQIEVTAEGAVRVWRSFDREPREKASTSKILRTWWHFVRFPPQQSAATSPQTMQSPPRVVVRPTR
jgi:hypothetical protein